MQLKEQLLGNTDALVQRIEEFDDAQFNKNPAPDSWSAANVLEHLYRSEFGLPSLFTSETEPLNDRAPDSFLEPIKKRFLESDKPMKASSVILPTDNEKTKAELIQIFTKNRTKIADLIEKLPEEELCLKFEHPIFGNLTRMEWVHFSIIHTQRHMRQLDRIQSQL